MPSPQPERPDPQRATFRERAGCVSCGGTELDVVWQGRFADEPVRGWLQAFHYSGDVALALGDEAFARVACRGCGMRFHRRVLTDDWLETLYARWISSAQVDAFEADRRKTHPDSAFVAGTQLTKHLLRLRRLSAARGRRPLRLLDFGCGDGKFLRLGAAFGFEAFGVDSSASRRERAGRGGVTIAASLEELRGLDPRAGEGYDCVTLFEVLEHVAEPRAILDALAARMRPRAVLLVEVPDCRGIGVPVSFEQFDAVQPLEHINHFTPATLSALCGRAGFSPAPRVPAHVTTEPLALLKTEASRFLHRQATSQYFWRD
jgi:SAM-dependent methyltransferase